MDQGLSDEIIIEKKADVDAHERALIDQGFATQAMEAVGHDGLMTQFAFVAKRQGVFLAALTGRLFWGSVHIKHLFVLPEYRNQGIGTNLMEAAFDLGRKNNCRFVTVETMSFQALDFYHEMGFQIDFSRTGYDRDCVFHYLSKPLDFSSKK